MARCVALTRVMNGNDGPVVNGFRAVARCVSHAAFDNQGTSAARGSSLLARPILSCLELCAALLRARSTDLISQESSPSGRRRGLAGQHALHDPVAIDEVVHQRREHVKRDQRHQHPYQRRMPAPDRLAER